MRGLFELKSVLVISSILMIIAVIVNIVVEPKEELVGQDFYIVEYDQNINKMKEIEGIKVLVEVKENRKSFISAGEENTQSRALEVEVDENEVFQARNTVIFEEKGLDDIKGYEVPMGVSVGGGEDFVEDEEDSDQFSQLLKEIKGNIGKEKVVVVSTRKGLPVGVYQGDSVKVSEPAYLPEMTWLNIDGDSLYIYRANYTILDSKVLE